MSRVGTAVRVGEISHFLQDKGFEDYVKKIENY